MSTHEAGFKKAVNSKTRRKSEQGKSKEECDNSGREIRNTENGVLSHLAGEEERERERE